MYNGGQPRKGSKTRNETPNSFDDSTTKPRLKKKISKSSKVQHCQNKTEIVQMPHKGLKEPSSKHSMPISVEIQKKSSKPPTNENRFSFDDSSTKTLLKGKISKSSKVQHCQNKTGRVQILYKGMKEPSKHSPISVVEIQKSSKTPNENKNYFDSTTKSKLKVKILRSSKVQHCQNKIGRGEIMLMFEFQSMKFGPIYAKGGFYSERASEFVISPNRRTNYFPELKFRYFFFILNGSNHCHIGT